MATVPHTRKVRDYESIGIGEVWLVSPEARTVEILLLEEGERRRSAILADINEIWPD
ncbi:MAG: hypothetical protein C5B51_05860 [Terriglobia bacterium]|nr:MAG: hypothetical protein C5B51_05860 [Terriglobia bacterium]